MARSHEKALGNSSWRFFFWVKNGLLRRQPLDDYQLGQADHRPPFTVNRFFF